MHRSSSLGSNCFSIRHWKVCGVGLDRGMYAPSTKCTLEMLLYTDVGLLSRAQYTFALIVHAQTLDQTHFWHLWLNLGVTVMKRSRSYESVMSHFYCFNFFCAPASVKSPHCWTSHHVKIFCYTVSTTGSLLVWCTYWFLQVTHQSVIQELSIKHDTQVIPCSACSCKITMFTLFCASFLL